jgi:hypothetical protein
VYRQGKKEGRVGRKANQKRLRLERGKVRYCMGADKLGSFVRSR